MINNWFKYFILGLLAGATGLCACSAAAAGGEPLQGVIEHEDRTLGFEVSGRVLEVDVERGQQVARGTTIAKLDDSLELPVRELRAAELGAAEAQLRLLRAGARSEELRAGEAQVDALRAQETTLTRSLARQRQLLSVGAASEASIDTMEGELRALSDRRRAREERLKAMRSGARSDELAAAEAHAEAAAASLALVDARLARYALNSLGAGSVVDVHVKQGEMVAAGAPAATIADLDHPYVDVFVPQARLGGVHVGAAAKIKVDARETSLKGRVEHVFPKTEFTPRFLFSESERPNLVVRVRIRTDDPKHQLSAGVPAFVHLLKEGSAWRAKR